jgi:hypothetical protein
VGSLLLIVTFSLLVLPELGYVALVFAFVWAFAALTVLRRWRYGLPAVQILPARIRLVTFEGEEWSIDFSEIRSVQERLFAGNASLVIIDRSGRKGALTTQDAWGYVEYYEQIRAALLARVPADTNIVLRSRPFEWLPPSLHRFANAVELFTDAAILYAIWQNVEKGYLFAVFLLVPALFTSPGVGKARVQSGDHTLVPSA